MSTNSFDLMTFGEIMLRLSPPRHARIVDGDIFEKRAGGAELNVASGVALLGLRTGIISKLPLNELGTFIKNRIRFVGVSDDYLIYDDSPEARLGLYYYEMGAAPRKPTIVYDRRSSSVTRIRLEEIPEEVYSSARMFHTSGISLALCEGMKNTAIELIRRFKEHGALISFDVNYRANLWSEEEARETIKKILPMVDVLFVSEAQHVPENRLPRGYFKELCRRVRRKDCCRHPAYRHQPEKALLYLDALRRPERPVLHRRAV